MILWGREIYYKLRTTDIRSIPKNLTMLKKEKNRDRRWHTDIAMDHRCLNYRDSTVFQNLFAIVLFRPEIKLFSYTLWEEQNLFSVLINKVLYTFLASHMRIVKDPFRFHFTTGANKKWPVLIVL